MDAHNTKISSKHLELLKESGIELTTALAAGLFSSTKIEAQALIKNGGSGLTIPYIDASANVVGYRIKQDKPLIDPDGKVRGKYLTSPASDAFIYFPESELLQLKKSENIFIVEGEKKLLKFIQERGNQNFPAVALAGCWMFRKSEQKENELHPVLEELLGNKVHVSIMPDTDYFLNPKVKSAYNRLAKILFQRDISVSIIDLRISDQKEKIGTDDFLLQKSFSDLQDRLRHPYVTFKQMDSEVIIQTIKKQGLSDKTFESLFNQLAFLDKFQIGEVITLIKSNFKGVKVKNLENCFQKSKYNFESHFDESSPENYVKHNGKEEGQDVLFNRVGKVMSDMNGLYLFEDAPPKLLITNPDFDQVCTASTKSELYDELGKLIVVEQVRNTEQGEVTISAGPMDRDYVSIFFNSLPLFVSRPLINLISKTPVFILQDNKLIFKKGHYPESKLIITNDFVESLEGLPRLTTLLNNIPFRTEADKENFLAMLITGVLFKNSLPGAFPCLFIRAQEQGSGKTKLAECLQYLIEGEITGKIAYKTDVELEKHLAAQIQSSSSVIIDNIRMESLNSTILEKLITDQVLSFRRLGTQTEIKKTNNVLVMLTMNGGSMTADLLSRCIVVDLDKSKQQQSLGFDPKDYAEAHRQEIIGEVLTMVLKTNFNHNPAELVTRFPKWEKYLRLTMEASGFNLFLSNAAEMYESIDQNLAKIFNLVLRKPDAFSMARSATEISSFIENSKALNEFNELSPTKIGKLLSDKSNRTIKFMAFDKIRYDFKITKIKDTGRGGDNSKYTISYIAEKSVASVVNSDESLTEEIKSLSKNVLRLKGHESEISHDPTSDSFLEPQQSSISPNPLTS